MKIENYIEHTILKPDATKIEVEKIITEGINNNFFGICINPNYVKFAREFLNATTSHKPKIVTVVNFPLSSNGLASVLFQTKQAILNGADEIDTVINLSALKNKNYDEVKFDLVETKKVCENKVLKVILETDVLSKEEIETACKIAIEAGVNFVKTSTGFVKNGVGATVQNVELMYGIVSSHKIGVKASGGIKTAQQAKNLIEAGATRLGTSSGIEIINNTH